MGNKLNKRQAKLEHRIRAFEKQRGKVSKSGNSAYKRPGSMNLHKQLGNK